MPPDRASDQLARLLHEVDGPLLDALREVPAPIWIADRVGTIRWHNAAAAAVLSARPGAHFSRFVASDGVATAREMFARKIQGRTDATVQRTTLNARTGPLDAELTSVPVREKAEVLGVITIVRATETAGVSGRSSRPRLSPRQSQVLELLAHGRSTTEIAATLQVTEATARNHVRHLLAQLGVRTRLEAVVMAFRNGWL